MKLVLSLAPAFVFAIAGGAPSQQTLPSRLVPREGVVLERVLKRSDQPEAVPGSPEGENKSAAPSHSRLEVTDTVLAVSAERVTHLARAFRQSEHATEARFLGGQRSEPITMHAHVDGAGVDFEWSESDAAYHASSPSIEPQVLERLPFDYDFTALLPPEPASVGDEWEVDPVALREMLLVFDGVRWVRLPPPEGVTNSFIGGYEDAEEESVPGSQVTGRVTATFAVVATEGGVELAYVTFEGEFEVHRSHAFERQVDGGVRRTKVEWSGGHKLVGRAAWNLDLGHLHSCDLTEDYETQLTRTVVAAPGSEEEDRSSTTRTRGTRNLDVEAKARP